MKYGQEIGESRDKTIIQKALGVLREDGVYAMFLWLEKEDEKEDKKVRQQLLSLLNEDTIKKYLLGDSSEFLKEFREFCEKIKIIVKDIDKLLFMKKLLEQTLTYAFYHARIGEKNVEEA
ncbi:TPA: hypothetical protein DCX16_00365 [bacterium]|nr:hypothetical protein [bacterium]